MLRSNLTRSQILGFGFAAVSLALAACGHGGTTPPTTTTPTPVPTGSVTVLSSPCAAAYVAYEPDAGVVNGANFKGLQTVHYEDGNTNLCGYVTAVATPVPVAFASSVQSLAFAPDFSTAVALVQGGRAASAGGYALVQDIFGVSVGQIVPAGSPYDLTIQPTPVPTVPPSPGASPVPTASATGPAETLTDASSVAIFGSSTSGIALTTGPAASSIIGVTSLTNAPPQYGSAVTYTNPNFPIHVANVSRSILAVSANGTALLARGPADLLSFSITTLTATGYQLSAVAEDMSLGSNVTLRGVGNIAFDPADATRALVAGSSGGQTNLLTLVTGLPAAITHASHIFLPAAINSIAIDATGTYAYVATPAGIYSVSGIGSGVLTQAVAFTNRAAGPSVLKYTNCNNVSASLTNVSSVRISSDAKFLVALGNAPGTVCPLAGFNSSVVAIPFNPAANSTPSPGPTSAAVAPATATPFVNKFVQNNVITPPNAADYFLVR